MTVLLKPVPIHHTLYVHEPTSLAFDLGEDDDLGEGIEHILAMPEAALQRVLDGCVAKPFAITCCEVLIAQPHVFWAGKRGDVASLCTGSSSFQIMCCDCLRYVL